MAVTENLKLELINASDFVSPDPINTAMKALDALGLDYIVEEGTSGEWWYRKWKNGKAECGIFDHNFGNVTHTINGDLCTEPKRNKVSEHTLCFFTKPFVSIVYNADGETPRKASELYRSWTVRKPLQLFLLHFVRSIRILERLKNCIAEFMLLGIINKKG